MMFQYLLYIHNWDLVSIKQKTIYNFLFSSQLFFYFFLSLYVIMKFKSTFRYKKTMKTNDYKKIYLAGGCFWGMEELFRKQVGVIDTEVGYMGGHIPDPSYRNHGWHAEAVEISYDQNLTSFQKILDFFFCIHDPTTKNRQWNDVGDSYRSAIFYQDESEKAQAQAFIQIVNNSGRWPNPVVTTLEKFQQFYPAEGYHQDYLQQNTNGYSCHYRRFESYLS